LAPILFLDLAAYSDMSWLDTSSIHYSKHAESHTFGLRTLLMEPSLFVLPLMYSVWLALPFLVVVPPYTVAFACSITQPQEGKFQLS
jgi:hypothetical protein